MAKERLHKAQRLLDEKPDRLYLENGKARLFELKNKLSESVAAIHDEYESYNRLNPENVEVTTSAGSNLPLLSPVEYFSKTFVKLAQWTRTNGESPRGGWGNYNDAEFHDFYVSYYPNLEIILPEFVERLRLFRNYLPIATVRRNQIREIVESGGSFSPYYKTDYSNIKVWTHGANHMPASFNNWKNEMNAIEAQISYILEVTSADGDKHYVDLGNISNNSKGVISLNKLAAAGIPVSGVVGAVSGGSSSKIRDMIKWIEENP